MIQESTDLRKWKVQPKRYRRGYCPTTFNDQRAAEHCLWAHDEQKQIDKMRELYDLLPVKPEWLTREQIDEYAARMNVK